MAINFPNSPTNGDTFTDGTSSWTWDGTSWNLVTSSLSVTPETFKTIQVAGQSDVVADSYNDTLTLVAGSNITLTTYAATDSVTITGLAGGGGGDVNQNAFSTIAVSGQTSVAADAVTDTLNLAAGSGITLTTNGTDTVTITSTSGAPTFNTLTDASAADLSIADIYLPAITRHVVTNNGLSSYRFDHHGTTDNPIIYAINGTTIAFELQQSAGHPFEIQDPIGNPYSVGLVHVATDNTVSTGAAAQGKTSGVLYWKIPASISGGYRYQCTNHAVMVGSITIKDFASL